MRSEEDGSTHTRRGVLVLVSRWRDCFGEVFLTFLVYVLVDNFDNDLVFLQLDLFISLSYVFILCSLSGREYELLNVRKRELTNARDKISSCFLEAFYKERNNV